MSHPSAASSIDRVLVDLARLVLTVVDGRAAAVVARDCDGRHVGWAPDEATEMPWLLGAGGSRRVLGGVPIELTVRMVQRSSGPAVDPEADDPGAVDPDAGDVFAELDRRVALVGSRSYVVAPVRTGDDPAGRLVAGDGSFVVVVRDDDRGWTPLELASIRTVAEIARVSIRSCGAR